MKKTESCVWEMMTRMIKPMKFIQEAKLKDGSATDEPLLLASQKISRKPRMVSEE